MLTNKPLHYLCLVHTSPSADHLAMTLCERRETPAWSQIGDMFAAGLEEFELKDLAYTVFAGACGRSADPDIIRTVCNQLDVRAPPPFLSPLAIVQLLLSCQAQDTSSEAQAFHLHRHRKPKPCMCC